MNKTLTNEQYQATLRDPVAFHKHILKDPYPLSGNQKNVMSAIGTFMETIAVAGSKGGKSTISAETYFYPVFEITHGFSQLNPCCSFLRQHP